MVNPLRWRGHEVSRLEAFSDRVFAFALTRSAIGHHLVRAGVGTMSRLIAAAGPLELAPIAPMTFMLMGPFHWIWGVRSHKRGEALQVRLAGEIEPAGHSAGPGS